MIDLTKANDLQAKLAKLRREGEERSAEQLAQKLGLGYVDLSKTPTSLEAVKTIPEADARAGKIAGIELAAKKLAVAVLNPSLPETKKVLDVLSAESYQVKVFIASLSSLEAAWDFYKFVKVKSEDITGKIAITQEKIDESKKTLATFPAANAAFRALDFAKVTPVIIIQTILESALATRASDIHAEAGEKKAKIRFRVDGILHDIFDDLPLHVYDSLVSRIKLLSGMKLNVSHEAQDGRFSIRLADKDVEMRVSIIPSEFGETIVMRILDPSATMVGLPDLGLREDNLVLVKKQLNKPNGLVLNTGPTGSGKTTTLYAFLRTLNSPEIKIITLEDPIEYRIEGIEQTQVDDEAGYTFADGLRAIVRQDPDVILVGEIRDLETADISIQAALTGHMVLSTLHTNDAVGAVPRLINLGVKAVSIGPALSLVIAQRLVRVLCEHCKKATNPDEAMKANIQKLLARLPAKVDKTKYEKYVLYEPGACDACNQVGYRGRVGIFEFLEGGSDLEETILKEASEVALRAVAERQGMVTMQQDGVLKVLEGKTTFDEVIGTTGEIVW
jgi:type II secretory ATPase GspE/PulE/Tfp pilus assembly ATPase PilB-like protein